jgi:hypothetical protein
VRIDDVIEELKRIRKMRGNLPVVTEKENLGNERDYEAVSITDTMVRYPGSPNSVFVVLVS